MQLKLINLSLGFIFLCFFNTALCQDNKKPQGDILQNEKAVRIEQLSNDFNNRATGSDYSDVNFYSQTDLTHDLKLNLLDFINHYSDRIYKIEFSIDTFKLYVANDLSKKEMYDLFINNGFNIYLLNSNNQKVKYLNNQEIVIPNK